MERDTPSMKILWIDEDHNYLEPVLLFLRQSGYEVELCNSLSRGEDLIKSGEYDLLILDVMITPADDSKESDYNSAASDLGMQSGLVFYRRMKSEIARHKTKVLVFTQRLDLEIYERFISEGLQEESFARKADLPTVQLVYEKIQSMIGK